MEGVVSAGMAGSRRHKVRDGRAVGRRLGNSGMGTGNSGMGTEHWGDPQEGVSSTGRGWTACLQHTHERLQGRRAERGRHRRQIAQEVGGSVMREGGIARRECGGVPHSRQQVGGRPPHLII